MDSRIYGAAAKALALATTLALGSAAAGAQPQAARRATTAEGRRAVPHERTKGLMLGVHTIAAPGLTLDIKEFETSFKTNFGPGGGLMIGYGFNNTFSSFVSFDVAKQGTSNEEMQGTFGLGHLEIGVRANLNNVWLGSPNTVPYLIGSFGRRGLGATVTDPESEESAEIAFHGKMLGLGAGIEHFFSPNTSFDAGLQLGFGKFDQFTIAGQDIGVSANGPMSIRLRLGVTWRPRV